MQIHQINHKTFSTRIIPKSIIVFFVAVQIFTGVDAGFRKIYSAKIDNFLNRYSICLSVIIAGIILSTLRFEQDITWYWGCTIKFVLYAIIFRLMKFKIYDFVRDIHCYHEKIPLLEKGACGIGMILYVSSNFIGRQLCGVVRCNLNKTKYCQNLSELYHFLLSYGLQASDIVGSFLILIIFDVFAFVDHIKQTLKKNFDVRSFEQRYVFLINNFENIKVIYNLTFIVELFINTPRVMMTLWYMMKYIKEGAEWFSYASEWLFAFHLIIQMCIPAMIAEMVCSRTDDIIMILNEQRRTEKEVEKLNEITRVLGYLMGRKLVTDIWRVIPVDLRLPLAMLSICTTYFIVILQFTHLYD